MRIFQPTGQSTLVSLECMGFRRWFVPTAFHKLRHVIRPKDFTPERLLFLPASIRRCNRMEIEIRAYTSQQFPLGLQRRSLRKILRQADISKVEILECTVRNSTDLMPLAETPWPRHAGVVHDDLRDQGGLASGRLKFDLLSHYSAHRCLLRRSYT